MQNKYYGFGFNPAEREDHFFVVIPGNDNEDKVKIYERFHWDEGDVQEIREEDILKIEITVRTWRRIADDVKREFNRRLKEDGIKAGKWIRSGEIPVQKLLGKELMILVWSLQGVNENKIPKALSNWSGFMPEERWWLYTETNAARGSDDEMGWRKALRYIMCEDPTK